MKGYNQGPLYSSISAPGYWRPILRAARADLYFDPTFTNRKYDRYREVHGNGLIELGCVSGLMEFRGETGVYLSPNELFESFANLIAQADRVRNQAGIPVAE